MWKKVESHWKEVLRLSWEAYKNDTIPVGVVILNELDEIVSLGRNVAYDSNIDHPLAGTSMGHAEMVALMKLQKFEHPNIKKYKAYVSLEPCFMCFGTMLMMGIRNIFYLTEDNVVGSSLMTDKTEYIKRRNIKVTKESGEKEIFQIIIQTSRGKYNPHKKIVDKWESDFKEAVDLGHELHKEKYFKNAITKNIDISILYDEVLNRYYKIMKEKA